MWYVLKIGSGSEPPAARRSTTASRSYTCTAKRRRRGREAAPAAGASYAHAGPKWGGAQEQKPSTHVPRGYEQLFQHSTGWKVSHEAPP